MQNRTLTLGQRIARQLRIAAKFLIPRTGTRLRARTGLLRTADTRGSRRGGSSLRARMLPLLMVTLACANSVPGATIYVNSRTGNDALDGTTETQVSDRSGPVKTLHRAVRSAGPGDMIVLANNGTPYLGGLSLYGVEKSGTPQYPLEILGNGCVLSGARPIEPSTWRLVSDKLWRITPSRKGWYQLVLNGEAVAEAPVPAGSASVPELPESTWCAFAGAIYFHPPEGQYPPDMPLELADEQTGVTLAAVRNIVIRDLTIRHFRQDGVHLHDRCSNVVLENVICEENGRAGIVVGGTSSVLLRNVTSRENRKYSLLVEDLAVADAEESTFDTEPVVAPAPKTAGSR